MKNLWIAALAAVLLVSCGGRESQNRNKQTTKTEKKMGVRHLTKAEFLTKVANYEASPKEWKFLGDKPCIVDFYASWCGPCKMIAPILEELAKEYDGKIDIYKVDTEKEQELAAVFWHPFDSHAAVLSDGRTASGRSGSDEQGRF